MRRLTALFVVLALAASSIVDGGGNHVKLLNETVFPLQYASIDHNTGERDTVQTHCSVFSVNPENHGWMTAAHCLLDSPTLLAADEFFIDGHPAVIVEIDINHDLALMRTPTFRASKGLKLAKRAPVQGDVVEVLGYAWGMAKSFYFIGVVSQTNFDIGWGVAFDYAGMTAIGGMSGSAVVDRDGRVVGVTHIRLGGNPMADPILGFTTYNTLKAYDRGWVFSR